MFPFFANNMRAVHADTTLSIYDKMVYDVLVLHADCKTRTCYPSQATIAATASCSLRAVNNSIKQLTAHGYIQKVARKRKGTNAPTSNLYILPDLASRDRQVTDSVGYTHPVQDVTEPAETGGSGYTHHVRDVATPDGQAQTSTPASPQAEPERPTPTSRTERPTAPRAYKLYRSNRSIDRSIDVAVKERIDKHFEREFFAEQTEYFEMYQTFADYMGEMLTDPQTVISKVPIKRERLEELIFSANAGNLCDFLAHIHEIRPMLHIRAPKPYYKTAWIEWCRDLAAWRVIPSASRAAHGATTKPNYDDLLEDLTA